MELLAALLFMVLLAVGEGGTNATNGSNWMTHIDHNLRDVPLMELAIPGSHNSGGYWMDETGPIASDQSDSAKAKIASSPTVRHVLKQYSLTQKLNILAQLDAGVRHLDIRNSFFNNTFHVYHAFYGHTLQHVFDQIRTFLDANPREVVFLGMNRCLDCTPEHLVQVAELINNTFADKIFPAPSPLLPDSLNMTLNDVWGAGKQLIVFADLPNTMFWPTNSINSPWYDVLTPELLIPKLKNMSNHLVSGKFNNYQAIVSPTEAYVTQNPAGSLEGMAQQANMAVAQWLGELMDDCQVRGQYSSMTMLWIDYVGDGNKIVDRVIKLNKMKQPGGCTAGMLCFMSSCEDSKNYSLQNRLHNRSINIK